MSISIPIFGAPRRRAPGRGVAVQKRTIRPSSIKYAAVVATGVALFGLFSPANATDQRNDLSSLSSVSASSPTAERISDAQISISGQDSARNLTSHFPWLAPIGHRQSPLVDVPQNKSAATGERAQERLTAQLDQKLIICRCWDSPATDQKRALNLDVKPNWRQMTPLRKVR